MPSTRTECSRVWWTWSPQSFVLMLAASAAIATGEGDHVDFWHEVSAWLVGHDPGVKLSLDFRHEVSAWLVGHDPGVKLSFAEADSEDTAQENNMFCHNANSGAENDMINPLDVAEVKETSLAELSGGRGCEGEIQLTHGSDLHVSVFGRAAGAACDRYMSDGKVVFGRAAGGACNRYMSDGEVVFGRAARAAGAKCMLDGKVEATSSAELSGGDFPWEG